ncbi:putative non-specific serine/threonine protein kinase [Helianthus annuus]|nr:putative non-specific serine/threonine protein kinase [Helianthus annuus]
MAFIVLRPFFLLCLLVLLTCTASLLSHDEECLALFQFKQTIHHQNYDADGFQKFESWSNTSNSDCCLSDGVVCSKGHVIGIDWSGRNLTGVINSSSTLFELAHLQILNLSMNNFVESRIPPEIARLKQLRHLDLSYSGFNGHIPNEFSHLMLLSSLDLSRNPLKLQNPGLEYLLKNMTSLEFLDLSGVDISSSVPRFLANFSSLRHIELRDCQLRDEFPSAVFHLPKLKHLSMGNNSNLTGFLPEFHNTSLLEKLYLFSTGFAGIIPESISNLNHLKVLSLQSCHFSGHIPGSLHNLTQLTYLGLAENELAGLVPSLVSLSKVTILDLAYNKFEKGSMYGWINKLTNLNELYLDSMNIHDEILPYLANLTKLSIVSMSQNFIFGSIPSSFTNLTQLIVIDLKINQLQGQIFSSFLKFKSLEYLTIGYNKFNGTVGLESFLGLNKLEFLSIDQNSLSFVTTSNYTNATLPELSLLGLSSCNLKEFPAFLRFQTKMEALALRYNEIEGLVPNWIWNNSQETLQMIDLANNFITGFDQHPQFLPWVCLEFFDMSYNKLQGRLPMSPQTC